jgi:PAS domain S-box-containing protein
MQELASQIREHLGALAREYDRHLCEIEGYAELPAQTRSTAAREELDLVATCLEDTDGRGFVESIQDRVSKWLGRGHRARSLLQALAVLEGMLLPLITDVQEAKFLWQMLSDARGVVLDADGAPPGRVEDQAADSQQTLQMLLDSMPFCVVVIARDKTVLQANRAALALMGYESAEQLVGKLCHDTLCPADTDNCPILDLGQEVDRSERILVTKDGERVPIVKSVVPISLAGQEALLEAFIDIREWRRDQEELRESQRMLQLIMDNVPQRVFWKSRDLVYLGCNRAFVEQKGLSSSDDVVGKTDFDLSPHEQAVRFRADDLQVMETGEAKLNYEEPQITPDGERRWLQTSKIPLRDAEGNVWGVLGMYGDITAQREAQREREQMYARRAEQVRAGVEVSQELAAVPELGELFQRVVSVVKERFGYYHVQIFRYEPTLDAVVLVTGYGEPGTRMLAEGHSLPTHRGVVGTAAATGESVLAPDTSRERGWVPNPHLPDTRGELAVPIKIRDRVLGIIDVQSDVAGALDEDDRLLIESISGPIALAIESTTLRQEMEDNLRELAAAQRALSQEGWATFRQMSDLPEGYLFDRVAVRPAGDLWVPEMQRAMQSRTLFTSDRQGDDGQVGAGVAPIMVQNEPVGVLGVYQEPGHPLSSEDVELVRQVSEQVAAALENARLSEMIQDALAEARTLYRFGELVSGETDVEAVYESVAQSLVMELGYGTSFIGVLDEDRESLQEVARITVGETAEGPISSMQDIASLAVRQREPVVVNDPGQDERMASVAPAGQSWRLAAVPVYTEEQVLGAIGVARPLNETDIAERDIRILEAVAIQTANAIQRAQLFEQTQQALAAADAATQRYLRDTWDAFLSGGMMESEGYLATPDGVAPAEDLWLPEMERALERDEAVNVVARPEDGTEQPRAALAVPLKTRGQVIGVVDFYREGASEGWNERERELIQALVDQIGESVESERQFAQTQATLAETERMYIAGQRISSAQSQEEILQVVLDIASSTSADQVAVFLFDRPVTSGLPVMQEMVAFWDSAGTAPPAPLGTRYTVDEYPMARHASRDRSITVPDIRADDQLDRAVREALVQFGFGAVAIVPLSVGNEWLGYSVILTHGLHVFPASEMRIYESVHDQAATALRSTRLYQEAQSRARREQLIREITSRMRGTPDLDTILNTAVQELGRALGVSRAFVRLSTGLGTAEEPSSDRESAQDEA